MVSEHVTSWFAVFNYFMGPPRISHFVAPAAPLVATDVTGATESCLLSWRRAGRLVLPRCSFALSPAQRYPPRPDLPHPVLSRTQQQPRATAYGRALLRAAAYDRDHPRTAVFASTSARRQHLREQQLTPPPLSLLQLPPWGEGDVGVAGVSCLQPVLPLPSAGSAVKGGERLRGEGEGKQGECERVARETLQSQQPPLLSLTAACAAVGGRVREGGGKIVKHLQLPPATTVAPPAAAPAATCPCFCCLLLGPAGAAVEPLLSCCMLQPQSLLLRRPAAPTPSTAFALAEGVL
ncbi:unnamed protein product [Closterium sp. NIES-53]